MMTVHNQPTSAIGESACNFTNVEIKEVALHSYKKQLAIFPEYLEVVKEKIAVAGGIKLPAFGKMEMSATNVTNDITILATQPNKWLLISDEEPLWLENVVDNEYIFTNEQSSAYSVIEITGQGTLAVMQQLGFIHWQMANQVSLTQLATDYNGIVQRLGETPDSGYRIYITRSMAKSFWNILKLFCE